MENFGKGRFSTRAQVRVHSSIYDLVHQFNEMAGQIETSIAHQRDLMNGISHELKTPLTSMNYKTDVIKYEYK